MTKMDLLEHENWCFQRETTRKLTFFEIPLFFETNPMKPLHHDLQPCGQACMPERRAVQDNKCILMHAISVSIVHLIAKHGSPVVLSTCTGLKLGSSRHVAECLSTMSSGTSSQA